MSGLGAPVTGLFGKMPAHGDFVRRALPRSFTDPWDGWLSAGIPQARAALAGDWDAAWEGAPVWRFRLSPGVCGPDAAMGVMATSADMVGRQFPLTLAAILPAAAIPPPDAWFEALEDALAQARAGDCDADGLAARLPAAPADDPDATLDGRSLFWTEGLPARPMPGALEFVRLLEQPLMLGAGASRPADGTALAEAAGDAPPSDSDTSVLADWSSDDTLAGLPVVPFVKVAAAGPAAEPAPLHPADVPSDQPDDVRSDPPPVGPHGAAARPAASREDAP